jgi:hypothetical protein
MRRITDVALRLYERLNSVEHFSFVVTSFALPVVLLVWGNTAGLLMHSVVPAAFLVGTIFKVGFEIARYVRTGVDSLRAKLWLTLFSPCLAILSIHEKPLEFFRSDLPIVSHWLISTPDAFPIPQNAVADTTRASVNSWCWMGAIYVLGLILVWLGRRAKYAFDTALADHLPEDSSLSMSAIHYFFLQHDWAADIIAARRFHEERKRRFDPNCVRRFKSADTLPVSLSIRMKIWDWRERCLGRLRTLRRVARR